jgi:hypothetical protein
MMKVATLEQLLDRLAPDLSRDRTPFSGDFAPAHESLLRARDQAQREAALSDWLRRYQPCLFGRIAAKEGLLSYCFLTEDDLRAGDDHIRDVVQAARLEWTRAAFEGRKSGFVVCVVSSSLANAAPNDAVLSIAARVASLYLLTDIRPDEIYLEEVFLEAPSFARATWRWSAGVNYFAANADGRWWQDHRMPGGIAFSVNSVGHLAKCGAIGGAQEALWKSLDVEGDDWFPTKIDSLGEALEFAMRTIALASDTVSGRATWLLDADASETCPIRLPRNLEGKSCSTYAGFYHTDVTLPSEYFRPDITRPPTSIERRLDFTYLWQRETNNPDHIVMGEGRRIRSGQRGTSRDVGRVTSTAARVSRWQSQLGRLDDNARLLAALSAK